MCVKTTYIKLQGIKLCENGHIWPGSDLKIVMVCYKVPKSYAFFQPLSVHFCKELVQGI